MKAVISGDPKAVNEILNLIDSNYKNLKDYCVCNYCYSKNEQYVEKDIEVVNGNIVKLLSICFCRKGTDRKIGGSVKLVKPINYGWFSK